MCISRSLLERARRHWRHGTSTTSTESSTSSSRPASIWCRINEGKWFGGVCLGVAAYGEFRVDWVRTVVLLLTLFTGGLFAVAYLVLMLVLPVVPTVAEYERRRDAPRYP
ncbi:PspC domain-containing protein [Micromonospora sp. NPDC049903]|uniref:PspC domain-containing protein n=1 Tax=Micromonospora sp. NPDC049903 TaxID=3364276 RepID=UPI0037B7F120